MVWGHLLGAAIRYGLRRPAPTVYVNGGCNSQVVNEQPRRPVAKGAAIGLGITQIIIAITCFIAGSLMLEKFSNSGTSGNYLPLWCGGWVLVSGILTLCVGFNTMNNCLVTSARVFNILATIGAGILGVIFYVAIKDLSCDDEYDYNNDYSDCLTKLDGLDTKSAKSVKICFGIMCGLSGIEFFIALFAGIYAGPGCCNGGYNSGGVVVVNAQPQQTQVISSHTTIGIPPQYPYRPNTSYAMSQPQFAQHCYQGGGPPYTSMAPMSDNSTNLAYTTQATHDQANLIDPPPYAR